MFYIKKITMFDILNWLKKYFIRMKTLFVLFLLYVRIRTGGPKLIVCYLTSYFSIYELYFFKRFNAILVTTTDYTNKLCPTFDWLITGFQHWNSILYISYPCVKTTPFLNGILMLDFVQFILFNFFSSDITITVCT